MRKGCFSLFLAYLCICLAGVSCGGRKPAGTDGVRVSFPYPSVPLFLTDGRERELYFIEHFWDRFPFADSLLRHDMLLSGQPFLSFAQAVSDTLLVPYPLACEWIGQLLDRASADSASYGHFCRLFREVFYDPNSPLTNEEYYIPVVAHRCDCPVLTDVQRQRAEYEYRLALRNRPGTLAADFVFTLPDGRQGTLYGLKADYTLLLFYNPGCYACEELHRLSLEAPLFNEWLSCGRLKVLAVYPDEDVEAWLDYCPQVPDTWINACDRDMLIRGDERYDLKAIPMMFLLDADKRVVLKDCSFQQLLEVIRRIG